MIDLLKLTIPFKSEYISEIAGDASYIDLRVIGRISGIKLAARSVAYDVHDQSAVEMLSHSDDGFAFELRKNDAEIHGLSHPWESLPSSFSGVAMKIYAGGKLRAPCVEIKASPAKILQGHNVFGSDSLELCGYELLCVLTDSQPLLVDMLDVLKTQLDWIDVTFSAHTPSQTVALQVIQALKNIRSGQIKPSRQSGDHETTVYWNKGSEHCERKAYIKNDEFLADFSNLEKSVSKFEKAKYIIEQNYSLFRRHHEISKYITELKQWVIGLVRFEARIKQRYLADCNVPRGFFDAVEYQKTYEKDGRNLIADLWQKAFKDLFKAFEGSAMNIHDDEKVHLALRNHFVSYTKTGKPTYAKADRIFNFFRNLSAYGYETIRNSYSSRMSFWRMEQSLMEIGIGASQLQQFTGVNSGNIVPLIRMINVDFSNQVPVWAPEFVSRYENIAA